MKTKIATLFFFLCFFGSVVTSWGQVSTLAYWDFSSDTNTPTTANALNTSKTVTLVGTNLSLEYVDGTGGLYTNSAHSENWNGGNGSKYWQTEINTTGFQNIKVSSYQGSSNTGPRNFKLQYRVGTGGAWTDVTNGNVEITGNANGNTSRNYYWDHPTTGATFNLQNVALPVATNDIGSVFLRWIMSSNLQRNSNSNVAAGGTSRIDEIRITGEPACVLPAAPTGSVSTVGSAPFCGNSITFTHSIPPPSGIEFYWQTTPTGESTTFPLTTNPTYTLTGTGVRTAYLRARRIDGGCWSDNAISATGTIYATPAFSVHPSNQIITANNTATFTATSADTVTRQWQVSTDGTTWNDLSEVTPYSGVTGATLTISNVPASFHGFRYRMIANNNGCTAESNPATLSVTGTPIITTPPVIDYTSCNNATIHMIATNVLGNTADLTYQWFAYAPGANDWSLLTDGALYTGTSTNTVTILSLADIVAGTQYYVRVSYKNQTCYTASKAIRTDIASTPTRWNGSNWTAGAPTASKAAILNATYNTSTANITACSLDLNGHTLIINSDQFATIHNSITGTGTINIQDSGSLVQVVDGVANGTAWELNMERITKKVYRYDFTYWGSPLNSASNFTLKKLSPNTFFDKYYSWDAAAQNWEPHNFGTTVMVPGTGYIVRAPQSHAIEGSAGAVPLTATSVFTGLPNNGVVPQNVIGNATTNTWNLLSNPYPSAINIEDFLIANQSRLEGTIYLWSHNTRILPSATNPSGYAYSPNDYATYNFSGSVATEPAPSTDNPSGDDELNNNIPTKFLAAGQAFFVKGLSSGAVTFSNAYRGGANNNFFKPAPTTPIENWEMTGKHRVWLNLKGASAFNQTLVGYIENATNELDWGYDGLHFSGNKVSFYSISNDTNLAIQGRSLPFNDQDMVPLGYKSTISGTLKISIDHLDGILENQNIYLEDLALNVTHNLKESEYSFTTTAGTFNNRFLLKYTDAALGTENPDALANSVVVYKNENTLGVSSDLELINEVTVYDLLGRVVYQNNHLSENHFSTQNVVLNEQVLIVKVKLENGAVVSKKVIY